MDAKAEARAELLREREAGLWVDDLGDKDDDTANGDVGQGETKETDSE
jgi:GTP-binding protein